MSDPRHERALGLSPLGTELADRRRAAYRQRAAGMRPGNLRGPLGAARLEPALANGRRRFGLHSAVPSSGNAGGP